MTVAVASRRTSLKMTSEGQVKIHRQGTLLRTCGRSVVTLSKRSLAKVEWEPFIGLLIPT